MARYLVDTKAVFLHIPRTGGTWIRDALGVLGVHAGPYSLTEQNLPKNHCYLGHYFRAPYSKKDTNFIIAIVRHPIAYYESVWKWITYSRGRMRGRWSWHPYMTASRLYSTDFNVWVEIMLREEPAWYTRMVELFVGPAGGEFCDYIGRTETLENDFHAILLHLGYHKEVEDGWQSVKSMGRRNNYNHSIVWNPDLKEKILISERLVIDRFYSEHGIWRRWFASVNPDPGNS